MAQLPCDLCDGDEPAVIMANNLVEPGAMCVGIRCMASYGIGLAVGVVGNMPDDDRKEYAGIVRPLAELCGIVKPKAQKAQAKQRKVKCGDCGHEWLASDNQADPVCLACHPSGDPNTDYGALEADELNAILAAERAAADAFAE